MRLHDEEHTFCFRAMKKPSDRFRVKRAYGSPCWTRTNIRRFKAASPTIRREGNSEPGATRHGSCGWTRTTNNLINSQAQLPIVLHRNGTHGRIRTFILPVNSGATYR